MVGDGNSGSTPTILDQLWDNNSSLTTAQKALLRAAMSALYKIEGYKGLLDKLVNKNIKLTFAMDPAKARGIASFIPPNNIYFNNSYSITESALREELIHAVQYVYYGSLMTNAYRNFEFEAKLYQDIVCILAGRGDGCPAIGMIGMLDNAEYCKQYSNLIYGFEKEKKSFDTTHLDIYNNLGQQWDQYPGNFNPDIEPRLILDNLK